MCQFTSFRGGSDFDIVLSNLIQKNMGKIYIICSPPLPKQNVYSLTVCNVDQYLPNGSEKSGFLSKDSMLKLFFLIVYLY